MGPRINGWGDFRRYSRRSGFHDERVKRPARYRIRRDLASRQLRSESRDEEVTIHSVAGIIRIAMRPAATQVSAPNASVTVTDRPLISPATNDPIGNPR